MVGYWIGMQTDWKKTMNINSNLECFHLFLNNYLICLFYLCCIPIKDVWDPDNKLLVWVEYVVAAAAAPRNPLLAVLGYLL